MPPFARQIIAILALFLALAAPRLGMAATTLLPNGKQCFSATVGISGMVGILGTITPGTLYVAGTYGGVSLTGGSGSGATATITVAGGGVTAVTIFNPGAQYVVGDVLSASAASIGGTGSGFSVPVSSTAINGSLAAGTVAMYVPSTTTPKQTWQDPNQVTLNANPISLDGNGCAIIYGVGSYRQQLFDSLGNLIWDQLTTDTSAYNSTFWAGLAGGTPNTITIVDPGFNATDGSVINFTALATNTSSTTLDPSGFGLISVLKDTTAGPVALTGGEIIATNPISVVYRATDNAFHILNPVIQSASGASAPLCGATGLKMVNGASNSLITITARNAVMVTPAGLVINRSAVSATINITLGTSTSAAGGMDGESPGTNAWVDTFLIDNGAAPAALGSAAGGNGLVPSMPSGYNYRCYLGAFRVNGSGNLLGQITLGNKSQYVVGGANLTGNPVIASGVAGTYSVSSPVLATASLTTVVPPTATSIRVVAYNNWESGTQGGILVAPNINWGGTNNGPDGSNGLIWPIALDNASGAIANKQTGFADLVLEANNIAWASAQAAAAIGAISWTDSVNAN